MSTKTGQQAEAAAATYLKVRGYRMIDTNWRTRWCEIDIIAERKRTIYFIEVKYRATGGCGSGLDYITLQKLQQMYFAAELWLSSNQQDIYDYRIGAVEVSGNKFVVTQWVDEI